MKAEETIINMKSSAYKNRYQSTSILMAPITNNSIANNTNQQLFQEIELEQKQECQQPQQFLRRNPSQYSTQNLNDEVQHSNGKKYQINFSPSLDKLKSQFQTITSTTNKAQIKRHTTSNCSSSSSSNLFGTCSNYPLHQNSYKNNNTSVSNISKIIIDSKVNVDKYANNNIQECTQFEEILKGNINYSQLENDEDEIHQNQKKIQNDKRTQGEQLISCEDFSEMINKFKQSIQKYEKEKNEQLRIIGNYQKQIRNKLEGISSLEQQVQQIKEQIEASNKKTHLVQSQLLELKNTTNLYMESKKNSEINSFANNEEEFQNTITELSTYQQTSSTFIETDMDGQNQFCQQQLQQYLEQEENQQVQLLFKEQIQQKIVDQKNLKIQLEYENSLLQSDSLKQYYQNKTVASKCKNCREYFLPLYNNFNAYDNQQENEQQVECIELIDNSISFQKSNCIPNFNVCTYHSEKQKFFSCRGCGADSYYGCCNKCKDCSKGCKFGKHIA